MSSSSMSKSAKEIYEASLALSNSAVGTTPKAPETPNSKYDQISFVYGSPLRTLDSSVAKLTDCDVIRLWMGFYDEYLRTSRKMQKSDKNAITRSVAKYLISFWQLEFPSEETKTEAQLVTKIKGLKSI